MKTRKYTTRRWEINLSWTLRNWTFGFWRADGRMRARFGVDFGPAEAVWVRKKAR